MDDAFNRGAAGDTPCNLLPLPGCLTFSLLGGVCGCTLPMRQAGLTVCVTAGCATGLAIGWSGGPASALQSCVGIGLLSYVVDLGGTEQAAKACCGGCSVGGSGVCASGRERHSHHHHDHGHEGIKAPVRRAGHSLRAPRLAASPLEAALLQDLPPVMWLGAMCGTASGYFDPSPWEMVEA